MPVIIVKGVKALQRKIDHHEQNSKKSLLTAMKREGFLLMKELRKEIRKGAPGGKTFKPLRQISMGPRKRPPLRSLAKIVHYKTTRWQHPPEVEVGFVGMRGMPLSKSWARIVRRQQKGFTDPIYKWKREQLARTAKDYGPRSKKRKFYFLRKTTRFFKTPARPIIDPFWRKWEPISAKRIPENWVKKMRGERI